MGFCRAVLYIFLLYATILAIFLCIPDLQGHLIVLSWVNSPWSTPWLPYKSWIKQDKIENFYITQGTIKLGAWIIGAPLESLKKGSHVFVYVHGNAKDRSEFHRTRMYRVLSKLYPVIAFDYSCFADSTCRHSAWLPPTEDELVNDLHIVMTYLNKKGVLNKDISIISHSLGTGVVSKYLYDYSVKVASVCLMAPMASIPLAAMDYPAVPLLRPFSLLNHELQSHIMDLVHMKLNTTFYLPKLNIPIMLVHGGADNVVPIEHSKILYNAILGLDYDLSHRGIQLKHLTQQTIMTLFDKRENKLDWTHAAQESDSYAYYKKGNVCFLNVKYGMHNDLESFDVFEEYLNEFIYDTVPIEFEPPTI